jgi:LCP family protein required for cell wall assembly
MIFVRRIRFSMAQATPRAPRDQYRSTRPETPPAPQRRRPKKRGGGSNGRRIAALVTLAVLGLGGGFILGNKTIRKYLPTILKHAIHQPTPQEVFPGQTAINLMIIGRDYDYTDRDQIIRKSWGRSDMLMVAHIDFTANDAHLLSIPRDTRADIPGRGVHKINAAHEFGGAPLTEQTIQSNFGVSCDKYITIDFEGFEQAIDELGGVDLVVDRKMDYDDNWGHLHIHLKPGLQHLDGKEAMGFVRFRHADSDFVRVQRQQTLLTALKEKLRNPLVLTKIPEILDTLDKHVESDLTPDQKVVLADYLHALPKEKISMDTLPSLDSRGTLVETDWAKADPMIQKIFGVTPPEESASTESRPHRRHHHLRRG